ncbi:MAG: Zn-ribbon domain-containing OB-fold protein [Nitrososphaerales archaeon]
MKESLTIETFYKEGEKGKLVGLACEKGHVTLPPRSSCRICASNDLRVVQLKGEGKIVSSTKVFAKAEDFPLDVPYDLALVELEEGGNLLGVMKDHADIGSKVRIAFQRIGDSSRIFFEPLSLS